jgi:hypothetical protein
VLLEFAYTVMLLVEYYDSAESSLDWAVNPIHGLVAPVLDVKYEVISSKVFCPYKRAHQWEDRLCLW